MQRITRSPDEATAGQKNSCYNTHRRMRLDATNNDFGQAILSNRSGRSLLSAIYCIESDNELLSTSKNLAA